MILSLELGVEQLQDHNFIKALPTVKPLVIFRKNVFVLLTVCLESVIGS